MEEKPLKFAMVSTFYPPYNFGGDGMYIYRLTNELANRGHSVDVFHCQDSYLLLGDEVPTAEFPNHQNVNVTGLKSKAGFLSPLSTQQTGIPFFKRQLKKALEEGNYDVIHFHNMSLIGITALSYGSAIKLYTTHEHWLVCPMHVLWKYNREVCSTRSCISCQVVGKRPPQFWRYSGLMERMLRHVDYFISPSRFTLEKHLELGPDIPIKHIPYFLPEHKSDEPAEQITQNTNRPYFLFVGRLEEIKGLQNVIPVIKNMPEYDLIVAGDGDFGADLRNQAQDVPNVKFLGRLTQMQLRSYYKNAVAVIVPSICFETFGIIIIESFACKTPVIVNRLGALPEVVDDSNGGFIYENESELASAIKELAGDPELSAKLGQNGYEAFIRYWTEEAHLKSYFDLISSVIKSKGNSRS